MVAEVIVDIAHSDVDKIFDYSCDQTVKAGMRVVVPFGRSAATGFVMRVKEKSDFPAEKLKKIYRAEEDYPALNPECLALSEKLKNRYRCPMALVLRLFLPAEMRRGKVGEKSRNFARLTEEPFEIPPRAKQQLALVEFLRDNKEADTAFLRERFGNALKTLTDKKSCSSRSGGCSAIPTAAWRERGRNVLLPPRRRRW